MPISSPSHDGFPEPLEQVLRLAPPLSAFSLQAPPSDRPGQWTLLLSPAPQEVPQGRLHRSPYSIHRSLHDHLALSSRLRAAFPQETEPLSLPHHVVETYIRDAQDWMGNQAGRGTGAEGASRSGQQPMDGPALLGLLRLLLAAIFDLPDQVRHSKVTREWFGVWRSDVQDPRDAAPNPLDRRISVRKHAAVMDPASSSSSPRLGAPAPPRVSRRGLGDEGMARRSFDDLRRSVSPSPRNENAPHPEVDIYPGSAFSPMHPSSSASLVSSSYASTVTSSPSASARSSVFSMSPRSSSSSSSSSDALPMESSSSSFKSSGKNWASRVWGKLMYSGKSARASTMPTTAITTALSNHPIGPDPINPSKLSSSSITDFIPSSDPIHHVPEGLVEERASASPMVPGMTKSYSVNDGVEASRRSWTVPLSGSVDPSSSSPNTTITKPLTPGPPGSATCPPNRPLPPSPTDTNATEDSTTSSSSTSSSIPPTPPPKPRVFEAGERGMRGPIAQGSSFHPLLHDESVLQGPSCSSSPSLSQGPPPSPLRSLNDPASSSIPSPGRKVSVDVELSHGFSMPPHETLNQGSLEHQEEETSEQIKIQGGQGGPICLDMSPPTITLSNELGEWMVKDGEIEGQRIVSSPKEKEDKREGFNGQDEEASRKHGILAPSGPVEEQAKDKKRTDEEKPPLIPPVIHILPPTPTNSLILEGMEGNYDLDEDEENAYAREEEEEEYEHEHDHEEEGWVEESRQRQSEKVASKVPEKKVSTPARDPEACKEEKKEQEEKEARVRKEREDAQAEEAARVAKEAVEAAKAALAKALGSRPPLSFLPEKEKEQTGQGGGMIQRTTRRRRSSSVDMIEPRIGRRESPREGENFGRGPTSKGSEEGEGKRKGEEERKCMTPPPRPLSMSRHMGNRVNGIQWGEGERGRPRTPVVHHETVDPTKIKVEEGRREKEKDEEEEEEETLVRVVVCTGKTIRLHLPSNTTWESVLEEVEWRARRNGWKELVGPVRDRGLWWVVKGGRDREVDGEWRWRRVMRETGPITLRLGTMES